MKSGLLTSIKSTESKLTHKKTSYLHQLPQGKREASSKNYNKMWTNRLLIVALTVIYYTHLIRK
jgi:hypothetical protein